MTDDLLSRKVIELTELATRLNAFSVPDSVTLYYRPDNVQYRRWLAEVPVKPYCESDRLAWSYGSTPEEALLKLIDAMTWIVEGSLPAVGGEITR